MSNIKLYTYQEMSELFKVQIGTIYRWQCEKLFKVYGYRKLGKWRKEALVTESEIKLLQQKKYIQKIY